MSISYIRNSFSVQKKKRTINEGELKGWTILKKGDKLSVKGTSGTELVRYNVERRFNIFR